MKEIPLTQNKVALVDDEDFDLLDQNKWHFNGEYAARKAPSDTGYFHVLMHRVIMNTPADMQTDHIDGNKLNNQKNNLRICTVSENMQNKGISKNNTSGYRGVYLVGRRWWARIRNNGLLENLGMFSTPEMAARAYDKKAKEIFGKHARLNFPEVQS